ncbi:Tetratricopeptide repeat-containing protein [Lentzea xinjiangensis]|uniref:Tetratricopeptide repeat-containing protein n=2 Tax=Lentzea xinjiangensis TaxID=402600 RepID=A0A1H9SVZ3_9PSEU|nr:Tetratricopeptide repeat-containing protein [Lentzea xinjiangensis]
MNRRSALRAAAVLAGTAAAAPLLREPAAAQAGAGGDADALFKAGRFEQAGRAYEEILRADPANLHAARRRGQVALLGNKFPDAEKYLKMALRLAPDDRDAHRFLGDCYLRQDELALSVPHWRAIGDETRATWFEAVSGEPYRIHGDTARLPWRQMDPMPLVEVSVNNGPPKRFTFYTGAPWLSLSKSVAAEAGLAPVAKQNIEFLNGRVWQYFGVLDSLALGGMELRNIPVSWSEWESGEEVETEHDGMIGMWVFYHLLSTFDYAGRSLVLRRNTPDAVAEVRAAAARVGARPLPMWLAREHGLHSQGSIAGAIGSGTAVVGVLFGGHSEVAGVVNGEAARRLRIRLDHDRPVETFSGSHPVVTYPCYPEELRLGDATANGVYCYTNPNSPLAPNGFDVPAAFFHSFHKPGNVTLDFTTMTLFTARGPAG